MHTFQKDDFVVYGKNGVFRIADIQHLRLNSKEHGMYYILQSIGNDQTTVYVPCDSDQLTARMRSVITTEQIDKVLEETQNEQLPWIEDKRARQETFQQISTSCDYRKILQMIHCIYQKKLERERDGKRLWTCDESVLNAAEKQIESEFSFALQMTGPDLRKFLQNRLGVAES